MEKGLLAKLSERLDRLEEENEHLRAALGQGRVVPGGDDATDDDRHLRPPMSRRTWLARGAAVAVGAVAGTALLAEPAAAVGEVLLNVTNTGTATTRINAPVATDVLSSVFYAVNTGAQGTGLHGYGNNYGVLGFSDTGTGVWGKASGNVSHAAVGVGGYIDNPASQGSVAVHGLAHGVGQIGVKGESNDGWAGWFSSEYAELTLGLPTRGAPTTDMRYHSYGDVVAQTGANTATLWFCVGSGTPGTWRRLGGSATAGAVSLLPAPVRVYDSRPGQPPLLGDKTLLAAGVDRVVNCTLNSSGVPTDAAGVLLNVTAVNQSGAGNLSVRANGVGFSGTSNLNWTAAAQTIANAVTSACGAGATIAVRLSGAVSSNVIVDVVGYFR
ncbi:MAG: hypothetical protein Q7V88_15540 [Actinomycetota bacterium]|nr:hypothetical protein [Actinomycetota bacterium]